MKVYTLDRIVREALMDRGYPMHFYLQFLNYGISCLRELNFDTLQIIKSVRIPIDSTKAGVLPCDYVDYIRVGTEIGQYIEPWGEKDSFNRLQKFDGSGAPEKYPDVESQNYYLPANYDGLWYTNYANDKGELTGRIFNARPTFRNSFLIVRERGQIQLDVEYKGTSITMDYITDGLSIDASNAIHPYATETIKAFIFWKMKANGRQYGPAEVREAEDKFYNQLRILRGRMNDIDVNDIRRSIASGYGPTTKNA